jgi:hypothetical protein
MVMFITQSRAGSCIGSMETSFLQEEPSLQHSVHIGAVVPLVVLIRKGLFIKSQKILKSETLDK